MSAETSETENSPEPGAGREAEASGELAPQGQPQRSLGGNTAADAAALAPLIRPARALIGWFDPGQVDLLFAGADLARYQGIAANARVAVARRQVDASQQGVLSPLPASVQKYADDWKNAAPGGLPADARIEMVDLRKVFAAQPFVFTNNARERVGALANSDLEGIARLTLPPIQSIPVQGQYDFVAHAYIFASPDPNLRILGNWAGEVAGHSVFGFLVGTTTSLMNIGCFRGRVFLRDGYHRAYGLIASGIHHAPALVQDFASFEQLGLPQGMLPQDAYLGDRPPRLPDYLDDAVATSADRPATQKLVVIQGTEFHAMR